MSLGQSVVHLLNPEHEGCSPDLIHGAYGSETGQTLSFLPKPSQSHGDLTLSERTVCACGVKDGVGGNAFGCSSEVRLRITSIPGRGTTRVEALRPEESRLLLKTGRRASQLLQFTGEGMFQDKPGTLCADSHEP